MSAPPGSATSSSAAPPATTPDVHRVCMIGSGNFACAVVRNVGLNVAAREDIFERRVRMWVFQEEVKDEDGQKRKLSELINERHENIKYLPGVKLPENVVAEPDLLRAAHHADIIIFCLPHQFIAKICKDIRPSVAPHTLAISLIKGFHHDEKKKQFKLVTDLVTENLGVPCACLMGANLAGEISRDQFCESTIACSSGEEDGEILRAIFETENFRVNVIDDVKSAEMCGALKNIVGVAAGMVDGMDLGNNTKAAVIRLGLVEMISFINYLHPDSKVGTFLQSCGVADLVTTCYGGRNRLVGEHFITSNPRKTLKELEKELLHGQKLQGPLTAREVCQKIEQDGVEDKFPLFVAVDKICRGEMKPDELVQTIKKQPRGYGELPLGI